MGWRFGRRGAECVMYYSYVVLYYIGFGRDSNLHVKNREEDHS